ncbi:glycosyltransferase [Bradyrhizobium sp. INPA01-394B]|uniref:Glycosyltransferase n=1 Tax=Bradyrhizobium campsiandrae TaxID=1729892 RepID=A0ABR7UAC8_9BRAD|nr:glycosyltransferase [Bradyrhizobium campsiandrae]MBC9882141.1 glycosyltransferase [Bradyrhizobium campsiandrae]MBC9981035.1 glycosyltransferase [Bradyrhizobium campsiandrae]
MQVNSPAISVLLPVYNAERFLCEAVESVLGQSYSDFELLVLNDGSTDGSLDLLRGFEGRDSRVKVFTRENRGLVSTLNELLETARAPYIARMDADDICVVDRFAKQLAFLLANPGHVAVGGWVMQINHIGLPIGPIRSPTSHDDIDAMHLVGHASIWHPTAMVRKDAILAIGGYSPEYPHAEDLDLWLRLAERGKLANLAEPVLFYRLHDQSVSQVNGLAQQSSAERACRSAWERRGLQAHFEATDLWRATGSVESRYQFILKYGWTAWANGYRKTWWYYATKALQAQPFSQSSWKLLLFGLRTSPAQHAHSSARSERVD